MQDASGKQKIGHADTRTGDSQVMLSDEFPDMDARSPKSPGGTAASFMIHVDDVDKAFGQALKAGGKALQPFENQCCDRTGTVLDPFGHKWTLSTHIEDLAPDEVHKRMEKWTAQQTHWLPRSELIPAQ